MSLVTRILPPDEKGSKLTFQEMDNNLYYLQSLGVSGLTFSANTLTITNPTGGTKSVTINAGGIFTGGTVSGSTIFTNGLTANTISATTYQNLPTDIRVTGGTFSSGILTFENNTGGTFNVTGLTKSLNNEWLIASGDTVEIESFTQKFIYGDLYVFGTLLLNENSQLIVLNGDVYTLSGGTISGSGQTVLVDLPTFGDLITSGTYSGGTLTLSTSNGSDVTINGFYTGTTDVFTTGATYNDGIIYFDTNVSQSAYTVNISSLTGDSNTFLTASTYDSSTNTITLTDNTNNSLNTYIDGFSGLSINGTLSATTLQSSNTYIESTGYLYFGDSSTDGSWRMSISGVNFIIEKRVSGNWIISGTFN